jgi:hypothetical protein
VYGSASNYNMLNNHVNFGNASDLDTVSYNSNDQELLYDQNQSINVNNNITNKTSAAFLNHNHNNQNLETNSTSNSGSYTTTRTSVSSENMINSNNSNNNRNSTLSNNNNTASAASPSWAKNKEFFSLNSTSSNSIINVIKQTISSHSNFSITNPTSNTQQHQITNNINNNNQFNPNNNNHLSIAGKNNFTSNNNNNSSSLVSSTRTLVPKTNSKQDNLDSSSNLLADFSSKRPMLNGHRYDDYDHDDNDDIPGVQGKRNLDLDDEEEFEDINISDYKYYSNILTNLSDSKMNLSNTDAIFFNTSTSSNSTTSFPNSNKEHQIHANTNYIKDDNSSASAILNDKKINLVNSVNNTHISNSNQSVAKNGVCLPYSSSLTIKSDNLPRKIYGKNCGDSAEWSRLSLGKR